MGHHPYAALVAAHAHAEAEHKAAGEALRAHPRAANGLTPDHVKASPEWKRDKARYDAAHASLRHVNGLMVKHPEHKRPERHPKPAAEMTMSGTTGGFTDAPCGPVTPAAPSKGTIGAIVAAKALRGARKRRRPADDRLRREATQLALSSALLERHLRLPVGTRRRWGEDVFIKTAKGWLRDGPPRGDGADDLPEAPEAARRLAALVNKAEWDDADHKAYQRLRGYLEAL